jgi:hypothetical protein
MRVIRSIKVVPSRGGRLRVQKSGPLAGVSEWPKGVPGRLVEGELAGGSQAVFASKGHGEVVGREAELLHRTFRACAAGGVPARVVGGNNPGPTQTPDLGFQQSVRSPEPHCKGRASVLPMAPPMAPQLLSQTTVRQRFTRLLPFPGHIRVFSNRCGLVGSFCKIRGISL